MGTSRLCHPVYDSCVDRFEILEIATEHVGAANYHEFLRHDSLSMGVYRIPAGGIDPQAPHNEDEAYYVIRVRAKITVGKETRPVEPGTLVFVEKTVPHRFHDIEEDLAVLVVFAPPET